MSGEGHPPAGEAAAAPPRLRLAIVTNIPAPYRVPVYNLLAGLPGITLKAIYAAQIEPDRQWDLPTFEHDHVYLDVRHFERSGRFIHYNPDVWAMLREFEPDVVLTTGYNPTHLIAFIFALVNRRTHVVMTDGTDRSERRLTALHRWVRRAVFAATPSFVVASQGGFRLLRAYGAAESRIHFSPLCANTAVEWSRSEVEATDIDLLFSGRLVEIKNGRFALEVARGVAGRLGRRVRMAILGSGPQEGRLRERAAQIADEVEVEFVGHVSQSQVPQWFRRARLFLFPTRWDPWGVVANEACMAGVPVLVSPHAGVAGELVRDGINGRVLPLEAEAWVTATAQLLSDEALRVRYAALAREAVAPYAFDNAAFGIADAVRQAEAARRGESPPVPSLSRFVRRQRVVIVQRRLPHYRVPLFAALRRWLGEHNVELVLVHGNATNAELKKNDGGQLDWAVHVPCRYLLRDRLCWQNLKPELAGADLVVLTQENRLLYNLLALTVWRPSRLAFWGHGRNFQNPHPRSLSERIKRRLALHVDWWFAYTELSAQVVRNSGFDSARITTLNNAVDTRRLVADCQSVTDAEIARLRERWQLGDGPIGLFVGSLYAEKRVPFLLAAGAEIARRVPGFRLVVVGDGPHAGLLQDSGSRRPWLRHLGVRYGREKAVCLRAAQIMLNPGLVGLGILDAFAAGLPMTTTDCKLHSPEIAYLETGNNGVMTEDTLPSYVDACVALLLDASALASMSARSATCAARYTIEQMTQNFGNGLLAALRLTSTT